MDEAATRYARELVDAIGSAVARDAKVDVCRKRARAAGFEMRVTLEAVVGITCRTTGSGKPRAAAPARETGRRRRVEFNASDRRFLRSLRIAADETPEEVE